MRKLIVIALLLLAAISARGQQMINHQDIGRFTHVNLEGMMSVEFTHGEQSAIQIETTGGVPVEQVSWNVNKEGLSVKTKPSVKSGMVTVRITYTLVESVRASGADVIFRSTVEGELFSADLLGGAKFSAAFDCFDVELRLTGSAAQISGVTRYATLLATQRSQLEAGGLNATALFAEAYSHSGIALQGEGVERLVTETNMGSTIRYSGKPRILRTLTKLGGSVVQSEVAR